MRHSTNSVWQSVCYHLTFYEDPAWLRCLARLLGSAGLLQREEVLAGHIALIRGNKVHCLGTDGPYQILAGDYFGVVSDAHIKWRGGRIPSAEDMPKVQKRVLLHMGR